VEIESRRAMNTVASKDDGTTNSSGLPPAALIAVPWQALAALSGNAATATLFELAARRAHARSRELAALVFEHRGPLYGFVLPSAWNQPSRDAPTPRRRLAELHPILVELTRQPVIRHLVQFLLLRTLLAAHWRTP
jgi:hypothetical protein